MGSCQSQACGSQALNIFMEKYGSQLVKFIAVEKARIALDQKFGGISQDLRQLSGEHKDQIVKLFAQKSNQLQEVLEQSRNDLNDLVPGGVGTVEKFKGQPIEETLGVNALKTKLEELKGASLAAVSEEEQKMWKNIESTRQEIGSKISQQRPQIPAYDGLPNPQKKMLMKEGEKRFRDRIEAEQSKMEFQLMAGLSSDGFFDKVKGAFSAQKVEDLFQDGIGYLRKMFESLKGGGFSSIIDNFF